MVSDEKTLSEPGVRLRDADEARMNDEHDYDDVCPNCGGKGVIYVCQDEIGCIDPEGGCDLCERRCDWCQPKKPRRA